MRLQLGPRAAVLAGAVDEHRCGGPLADEVVDDAAEGRVGGGRRREVVGLRDVGEQRVDGPQVGVPVEGAAEDAGVLEDARHEGAARGAGLGGGPGEGEGPRAALLDDGLEEGREGEAGGGGLVARERLEAQPGQHEHEHAQRGGGLPVRREGGMQLVPK